MEINLCFEAKEKTVAASHALVGGLAPVEESGGSVTVRHAVLRVGGMPNEEKEKKQRKKE